MEERELIRRWLPSDIPVIEFGGGLGAVSCLSSRKLDDPSRHVVVEANPAMATVLEHNRDLNGCKFQVLNKAIAYDCTHIHLNIANEFVGSTIKGCTNRTVQISTTTISDIMTERSFDQAGIICDIEGAEFEVIRRELPVLGRRIRFFMAEMHPTILGADTVSDLLQRLQSIGFVMREQIGDTVFLSHND
jgi:FkbM family methyltransferase